MTGIVKWFSGEKGFGFIATESDGDFFVHQSNIVMEGYRTLQPDESVEFDIEKDDKGRNNAVNVKILENSENSEKSENSENSEISENSDIAENDETFENEDIVDETGIA